MAAHARVCLVDDDIFVRDALALGLSDAGYEVLTAPGAAAGLDIVHRERVDAIVTDMNMPGTHGAQFISELRNQWPELPIVAISGAATIDGRNTPEIAAELGANQTLIKPFRARTLADILESVLRDGGAARN
ncbi:MAG TPA: response regulator [Vitreimonas sp.]|uniref:response regulator n=1 Tax=Vitreimonas sp. TaxID=3069702 RepID=UPI002D6EAEE3|nr:response regulator [Vitreimonas sp.]HYD87786.1 response regulator [Vitreimonas sp.]